MATNIQLVLVKIDSNAILVEPMKSRKDAEMIQTYNALLLWLKRAGIIPKKHVIYLKDLSDGKCDSCEERLISQICVLFPREKGL